MNFGYCVNMLAAPGGDGTGREWIKTIHSLGFDYVELPLAQMMRYEEEEFRALFVEPLEHLSFSCHCCNNFFPASIPLTGPQADHTAALSYAETAMERAARLGASKIVFGSAGARNLPVGFPASEGKQQLAELLCKMEKKASQLGITFVLEPLNRLESNILCSLEECLEFSSRISMPHVQALADTYHMHIGNEPFSHLLWGKSRLRHVHLARTLGRSLPCAGDEVPWKEIFRNLEQIGYEGDLSIEAYAPEKGRMEKIRDALNFLRTQYASIHQEP